MKSTTNAAGVVRSGRLDEGGEGLDPPQRPNNIEKDYHHVSGVRTRVLLKLMCAEARYPGGRGHARGHGAACTLASFEIDSHTGTAGQADGVVVTQVPYYLQHKLSLVLEMPMQQIRVIKPLVGGGFGGKSEVIPLEIIAAVAARKAKAPVKITYTREEVFWAHRGRPRTIIDLKTGVKNDGTSRQSRRGYSGRRRVLLIRRSHDSLFRGIAGRAL